MRRPTYSQTSQPATHSLPSAQTRGFPAAYMLFTTLPLPVRWAELKRNADDSVVGRAWRGRRQALLTVFCGTALYGSTQRVPAGLSGQRPVSGTGLISRRHNRRRLNIGRINFGLKIRAYLGRRPNSLTRRPILSEFLVFTRKYGRGP